MSDVEMKTVIVIQGGRSPKHGLIKEGRQTLTKKFAEQLVISGRAYYPKEPEKETKEEKAPKMALNGVGNSKVINQKEGEN